MGLRREKEAKGSSGAAAQSGQHGLLYHTFVDASLKDYELPQDGMRAKQLAAQLAQKANELERLRNYVTKLEEGENGLIQELTGQLATKDEEISRIAALYTKKEAENKKLSTAFEAHIISEKENAERIKALLVRKEQDTASYTERLRKEIERKDAEISSLRNSLIQSRQESRTELPDNSAYIKQIRHIQEKLERSETETCKLQKTLLEEQKLSQLTQYKLKEQAALVSQQVEELKILLIDKQKLVQSLQAEFEKNAFQTASAAQAGKPSYQSHNEVIEEELERKNKDIVRLERRFLEEQKLSKSAQSRLKEQIASATSQLEELKSFLIEKENLVQNLEAAFEKRLAAKDEEIRHMKEAVEHKPATGLHREIDGLKSELQIKEEASTMMAEEMAKIKEQSTLIRRRLEERQKIFFESERAYEELIAKLREQHDARIKALIQEASQKEVALSSALEEERARMRKETALMKEKEKQIAETLHAFTRTSEQLIKLGNAATAEGPEADMLTALKYELETRQKRLEEQAKELEEKEKYAQGKEGELKKLLETTEAKITLLKEKEVEVEKKEQLLLTEQEALSKELDVLTSAGLEIGKSRQYLQQKLEQISQQAQQPLPQQPQPLEMPLRPEPIRQPEQPLKQQSSAQEFSFGPQQGVQEAQEEEQFETSKFSGISSAPTQVQQAVTELSDEEGMTEAPKAATIAKAAELPKQKTTAAAPKIKPVKLSKAQKKQLAKKEKLAAKQLKQKPQPKPLAKPSQLPRQTATAASAKQQKSPEPKEMPIGAREADGHTSQELFTELGGYSETDEIKSIVEVGLQHGDSIEQIRESLLVSGYSKQNIEKVLSGVKK